MSIEPPGAENIGVRLSLRLRLPEGGFQDIVGILKSNSLIEKRDGATASFDPEAVVAWRKVEVSDRGAGTGAPLSIRIREMEIAAANTWPPAFREELGDWVLRATGKFTMRANSVLVVGEPGVSLDKAMEEVTTFYNLHSLPAVFHIPLPTYQNLDAALEEKGWTLKTRALVMITDIDELSLEEHPNHVWKVSSTFDDEWLQLQNDHGVSAIMKSAPAMYASLKINNVLVAVGRAANYENWTVLTRLFVHADFRRMGIGSELISRLLHHAKLEGATKALLQVDDKNTPAINAYEQYGFRTHHSYVYRVLSDQLRSEC